MDSGSCVIAFNPRAGGAAHEALRALTTRLEWRAAPVIETTTDESFAPRLHEWIRQVGSETGSRPIAIAVGGDGTLSLVVNALEDPASVPVAIVPCGSGNDVAAAIGCADVSSAIAAIERRSVVPFDLGVVNGRRFVNCVGMGLDAEVTRIALGLRRRGYPPGASYYGGAVIGLFSVKPVGITISTAAGTERIERGVMVTVGNGPTYGGGFRGAPNAVFDDGCFDLYAYANVEGLFARLRLMQRIRAGTHVSEPCVTAYRSASAVVEFDREVAMHVDGEIASVRRAEISLVPRGLRVIVGAASSPHYGWAGAAAARS